MVAMVQPYLRYFVDEIKANLTERTAVLVFAPAFDTLKAECMLLKITKSSQ